MEKNYKPYEPHVFSAFRHGSALPANKRMIQDCLGDSPMANYYSYMNELETSIYFFNRIL